MRAGLSKNVLPLLPTCPSNPATTATMTAPKPPTHHPRQRRSERVARKPSIDRSSRGTDRATVAPRAVDPRRSLSSSGRGSRPTGDRRRRRCRLRASTRTTAAAPCGGSRRSGRWGKRRKRPGIPATVGRRACPGGRRASRDLDAWGRGAGGGGGFVVAARRNLAPSATHAWSGRGFNHGFH